MWVWMRMRQVDRPVNNRWRILRLAGIYTLGAILLAVGIAVLGGR
jgi:hypothetical protein